jgi:hypothetical protein
MTREIIHARTNGNPFFIEEVVQSLVEGGRLAGRRGAYRLARPIEMLQVPASVQAVLSSRIDRLPEREKPVLQTAAGWRTMAFRFAMRWTPRASTAVTTAGKPSGTAATASATPKMSTSKSAPNPRTSSTSMIVAIITTAMTMTLIPSSLPTRSSSRCSGVVSSGASFFIAACLTAELENTFEL